MHIIVQLPKPRSDAARTLADRRYTNRIVRDKKKYSRKGKISSKKFEDSHKPITSGDWLREFIHSSAIMRFVQGGHHDHHHHRYRDRRSH